MAEPRACRIVREGLTEYLEEALPPARRQGLETHLQACSSCRALLDQVRRTIRSTGNVRGAQMPPGMKDALLRALRRNGAD